MDLQVPSRHLQIPSRQLQVPSRHLVLQVPSRHLLEGMSGDLVNCAQINHSCFRHLLLQKRISRQDGTGGDFHSGTCNIRGISTSEDVKLWSYLYNGWCAFYFNWNETLTFFLHYMISLQIRVLKDGWTAVSRDDSRYTALIYCITIVVQNICGASCISDANYLSQ